ncbi:vacuolar ATP synthase subunit E, putative [Theileria equi strain WA]|uniref:Vacuolar ATP synthase subunit E, putative n=1 Tax=Theileria equi strain WA TaxID=1537102 RepID=L1LGL7_THEEQ|nr:vacuolar ATP synthase subunit E, putative [Theileria equi strain WA]EKX74424.1 vacuolar ATP synthase subunit E, putative [Theileria equi strain WA]|eukprot:XP_004833876.1 vacuolar ATP synthase subunit E, putative [Theileria equi strain WA]
MDALEAQNQIKQMVNFILNEAKDKAEEIESGAIEEFNIEKLTLFQQKKDEVRSRIAKRINALKLEKIRSRNKELKDISDKLLRYQCDVIDEITQSALGKLKDLVADAQEYKKVLIMLILSGCFALDTENVLVRCRTSDVDIVESVLSDVRDEYERIVQERQRIQKSINISVDRKVSLSEDMFGVVLTTQDGTIECDSTLNNRLNRCCRALIPELKAQLFTSSTVQ